MAQSMDPEGHYFGNEDPMDDSSDQSDDEWNEMENNSTEQTLCLFCGSNFHTIAVALDHCRAEHNFNLLDLKVRFQMDCYSYIKMVNYIRLEKPTPEVISALNVSTSPPWADEKYLKPADDVESWLMYDFDDLGSAPSTPHYAIDGKDPINDITYADLLRHLRGLTMQLEDKDQLLMKASKDMERMRQLSRTFIEAGDSNEADTKTLSMSSSAEYFESYSHFSIHHEMLSDKVRTESYQKAILGNPSVFAGSTVLDVGCGTGILSMFCRSAGASHVIGVDAARKVLDYADRVLKLNNATEISLVCGSIESSTLPASEFDIIVSEWMGYFLLFEGMLDSIIFARDKYLRRNGGKLLPNRCTMHLAAVDDNDRYKAVVDFWDDVYGYNMRCLRNDVLSEANVETVPKDKIISESPALLVDIDLYTCTRNTCNFTAPFRMIAKRAGSVTSLCGYFNALFELKEQSVALSTAPESTATHWEQTVFYLHEPLKVNEGDLIEGVLTCHRQLLNERALIVTIKLGDRDTHTYSMN